jgi:hypothetical protein
VKFLVVTISQIEEVGVEKKPSSEISRYFPPTLVEANTHAEAVRLAGQWTGNSFVGREFLVITMVDACNVTLSIKDYNYVETPVHYE